MMPTDYSFVGFQFHKGAIRTVYEEVQHEVTSVFQFHKGAIRTQSRGARIQDIEISIP